MLSWDFTLFQLKGYDEFPSESVLRIFDDVLSIKEVPRSRIWVERSIVFYTMLYEVASPVFSLPHIQYNH
jgi:hypothetical protein